MTYPFNPATNTVEHDEFIGTTGNTISTTASDTLQFQILNIDDTPGSVTYSHPLIGEEYTDMVITTSASSFTYSCKFEYSFERKTRFLYQPNPTQQDKQYFEIRSPHLLPPNYAERPDIPNYTGVYHMIPPVVEQVPVIFTIVGRERTITTVQTEFGPSVTYGSWYAKTYTWSVTINHNFQWTAYAIKKAVRNGTGYKEAIDKYAEAILDSITPPSGTPE